MSHQNEEVTFIAFHQPALDSGEYTVKVSQDIKGLGTDINQSVSKTLFVAGERFSIDAPNIFNCFPLPGTTGNYGSVLPHISLTRSTLPWERYAVSPSPTKKATESDPPVPWMWLFVYDDDDLSDGNVIKQSSMSVGTVFVQLKGEAVNSANPIQLPGPLTLEPGETTNTTVDILEIKSTLFGEVFPNNTDLKLLTCVRKNTIEGQSAEHALCMANRLPKPGVQNYACLLSLEERLTATSDDGGKNMNEGVGGNQSFVILHEWSFKSLSENCYQVTDVGNAKLQKLTDKAHQEAETEENEKKKEEYEKLATLSSFSKSTLPDFYTSETSFKKALEAASSEFAKLTTNDHRLVMKCFEVSGHSFEQLLTNVSADVLKAPKLSDSSQTEANAYLESGAIPFPHVLHDDGNTMSWYRGPLGTAIQNATQMPSKPVATSDQLLRFDKSLQMLDVSYAAAWELGKLLTLNNKSVASSLYSWKKQQVHAAHQQSSTYGQLLGASTGNSGESAEHTEVQAWITGLGQLSNIPFNYLVPYSAMLPPESIRFFTVDQFWLNSLSDGALSIGRTSHTDAQSDEATLAAFGLPITQPMSGLLLRSEAVSGWPHLKVTAYSKMPTNDTPDMGTGTRLTEIRSELLGPDVILFLFEGNMMGVDVHLKTESLHFGFDEVYAKDAVSPTYEKSDVVKGSGSPGNMTWSNKPRTSPVQAIPTTVRKIPISTLATSLCSTNQPNSAAFAPQMIQGTPNIMFTIGNSGSGGMMDAIEHKAEALKEGLVEGIHNAKEDLEEVGENIQTHLEEAREDIGNTLNSGKEHLGEMAHNVADFVHHIAEDVTSEIHTDATHIKDVVSDVEDAAETAAHEVEEKGDSVKSEEKKSGKQKKKGFFARLKAFLSGK